MRARTLYLYRDDDGDYTLSTSEALKKNEWGAWNLFGGNAKIWVGGSIAVFAELLALPEIEAGAGPVKVRLTVERGG